MHALALVVSLVAAPQLLVPGRALVKLKDVDDARTVQVGKSTDFSTTALDQIGARQGVKLSFVRASLFGWAVVDVSFVDGKKPSEEETRVIVSKLGKDEAVDVAAEETWMKKLATTNDPGLPQMWHLDQIGVKSAWDVTQGLATQRIGIADTGIIRQHEDLASRIQTGFDFVADANAGNDGNGRDADFQDSGDDCGGGSSFHGTHVAGTIGAAANNGRGVAGINWNAKLVIARVLGRCGGSTVDIMEGAAWMAGAHINGVPDIGANKVSVMNLSLGAANRCSSFEQQFVDFINQQGVVFVAAAGNDAGPVGSPANCRGTVAVAATGPTNRIASYSSFGPEVSIVAPGGDGAGGNGVLSTIGPSTTGYRFNNGTSMASPHVTGAISLIQALRPSMARADIVNLLRSTGGVCTGCQGVPALRIGSAVASLGPAQPPQQPTTPPPPPPSSGGLQDDPFEDNDAPAQATRATCGVDDGRPVALAADQDWFSFTPPQGRRIAIAIDGGSADLDLYVLDSTGQRILARSEGGTGVERITGTAGGGTLMVLVNPYVDQQRGIAHQGPYRLTLTCGAAGASAQSADFEAGDPFEEVLGELEEETELQVDEEVAEEVDYSQLEDVSVSGGCSSSPVGPSSSLIGLLLLLLRRRQR